MVQGRTCPEAAADKALVTVKNGWRDPPGEDVVRGSSMICEWWSPGGGAHAGRCFSMKALIASALVGFARKGKPPRTPP